MRIYLAARYSRRIEMLGYAAELEAMGHRVTSRWIQGEHQIHDTDITDGKMNGARFALEDLEDLEAADTAICFTEPPRSGNSRGGRHVEFGYAMARGKAIIAVGYRENVFHWLPGVAFCEDWEAAKRAPGLAEVNRDAPGDA